MRWLTARSAPSAAGCTGGWRRSSSPRTRRTSIRQCPDRAHYERAGLPSRRSPTTRGRGGRRGVYANDEAIVLAGRGLSLLQRLPATARRDGAELELQLVLAPSYRVTKGWAAPELSAVLDRTLALCDKVGTGAQRAQIL